MWIRAETRDDHDAIRRLTDAAFAEAKHAGGGESRIIDALRDAGALSLSLVADIDGRIAGHVAVSPVALTDGTPGWFGLGPVAVDPRDQGHGVGSALIRAALAELHAQGAAGCVVLGDPAYYARFGFRRHASLRYPYAPADCFLALPSGDTPPDATVAYHDAFTLA
jgi:putative acetyltransferase